MGVRISRVVLDAVVGHAAAVGDAECCGLLVGSADRPTATVAAANVAQDVRTRFEIDPAVLLAAYRAQRTGGPALLGCYHSHPGGDATPSRADAADAAPNGWLWLIVAGGTVALWRAVPCGALHGRFDHVRFTVEDAA